MRDDPETRWLAVYRAAGGPASGYGFAEWLARATGGSARSVRRWQAGGFPPYMLRLLDLLERVPVEQWPYQWHYR